jgi:hypothetical protein
LDYANIFKDSKRSLLWFNFDPFHRAVAAGFDRSFLLLLLSNCTEYGEDLVSAVNEWIESGDK